MFKKKAPSAEPRPVHLSRTVRRIRLLPDEQVVVVATPDRTATFYKYVITLGLYGLWRKRDVAVVTNQRVLRGSGIFRRTERSIPMSHIEDVVFTRKGFSSYAELAVNERGRHKVQTVGPLSARVARRLTSEIVRRI